MSHAPAENTSDDEQSHNPALTVKTDVYEGPMELLLQLIQKRQMFVNDISLAQVTDDFLQYVNESTDFPVGDSAQFLSIASALMLIKSKSLLPDMDITTEEEGDIEDLEERLKLYKRIKDLSEHVSTYWYERELHARSTTPSIEPVFSPNDEVTAHNLARAMQRIRSRLPKRTDMPQAEVHQTIRLKDTVEKLTQRVQKALRTQFSDISGYAKHSGHSRHERLQVVVHFLALLELAKQGQIQVRQSAQYEDIELEATRQSLRSS